MTKTARKKAATTPAVRPDVTREELRALYEAHGHGLSEWQLKQTKVRLADLVEAPQVFQPRDESESGQQTKQHVDGLVKVVKEQERLDPILVFAVNGERFIVDGHCRVRAYWKRGLNGDQLVPVEHLQGAFIDAVLASIKGNSKNKLPLTFNEKCAGAWRVVSENVLARQYTVRQIAAASGISKSAVQRMINMLREDPSLASMAWKDARKKQWESQPEWDAEKVEQEIIRWTQALMKAHGKQPNQQPDIFLSALERAYPRVYAAMVDRCEAQMEEFAPPLPPSPEATGESDF